MEGRRDNQLLSPSLECARNRRSAFPVCALGLVLHSRGSELHNLKNENHRAPHARCDLRSSARVALGEPQSSPFEWRGLV